MKYVITWAQNLTPVHAGFFATLRQFASQGAELIVIPGRYKNPTSRWSQQDQEQESWAPALAPYLDDRRHKLCRNLCLYGDMSIQPTAVRPLTGFEVFAGGNSAIFGHPKRALETVATATRMPRLMLTTGACTLPNYTRSKAGRKGQAHHTIGALVVEIERDGTYHVRHVSAEASGAFIDLDRRYTPGGVEKAPPALAITFGDIHSRRTNPVATEGHKALCELLKPRNAFLHDTLDFSVRNHHDKTLQGAHAKFKAGRDSVEEELTDAAATIREIASWVPKTYIVRSNHDQAFERWLNEADPKRDIPNASYYYRTWARMFRAHAKTGKWPMAFEMEARRLGVPKSVRFLSLNEDVRLKGVSHGFHGHKGVNGARGSLQGYAKLGVKTTTGHGHAPAIMDGAARAGVFGDLDHGYNDLPSGWLVADVVQYANGKRAVIVIVNGRFRS
jgi:hypothetical protein